MSLSTLFCLSLCSGDTQMGVVPRWGLHPTCSKARRSKPSFIWKNSKILYTFCSVLFCKTGGTTMTTRMTTTMTMMTTTMTNNKWDEDDNPPKPIPKMPRQFFSNTFSATIGALTSGTKSKATTNLRMNENLLKSPFQEHFVHSIF